MIPDISRKPVLLKKTNIFQKIKFASRKAEKLRRLKQFCKVGQHYCRFEFNPLWFTIRRFANCGSQSSHNKKLRNFL